ncbi:pyocin activator PrtN family protein [Photobacterium halotolerans]|uniref:pyocin activator PrtN family protein n=1 Tax=Photobacterium halotolerans TaxID=265726 RepID=UPI001372C245|nr:pyocin activator PrtN family protein [Photobacterium halotolerans]NAW85660.1 pyocin activator protein PrtN [Photobacterium halotolerans]
MNFLFALLARFGSPTVELKQISEEFFGIKPKTAEQQVKAGAFPIPAFKLRDSERSPTLVRLEDLAKYMNERYQEAADEWASVNRR